ncbi:MAG TPA: hypothetical protein VG826_14500 [Pirellulales bacterium]|nr:hypothetical protein [Pirellulales bacterium]
MSRRFQFSLRGLLVMIVITGIACAAIANKIEAKRREREVIKLIKAGQGRVMYDWERDDVFLVMSGKSPRGEPPGWQWCRMMLGDDFFARVHSIHCGNLVSDADLEQITTMIDAEKIEINSYSNGFFMQENNTVTDAGLFHLKRLTGLKELVIYGCSGVTDAGIVTLKKALPKCQITRAWPWRSNSIPERW